jgi:hypothetical protein
VSPEEAPVWKTDTPTWWVSSAQVHALAGRLQDWVYAYLETDGWNDELLDALRSRRLWWRGPVQARLSDLERICGPESHMAYHPNVAVWERNIKFLQQNLRSPLEVPPLLVEYREGGRLIISDGAHRHEAMRRLGWHSCWIVLWYETEEALMQHGR